MNPTPTFASLAAAGRPKRLDAEFFLDELVLPLGTRLEFLVDDAGHSRAHVHRPGGTLTCDAHALIVVDNESGRARWAWACDDARELGAATGWLREFGLHHGIAEFAAPDLPSGCDRAVAVAAATAALEQYMYLEFPAQGDDGRSVGWLLALEDNADAEAATAIEALEAHAPSLAASDAEPRAPRPEPVAQQPADSSESSPERVTFADVLDDAALLSAEVQAQLSEILADAAATEVDVVEQTFLVHLADGRTETFRMHVLAEITTNPATGAGTWTWNWALDASHGSPRLAASVREFGIFHRIPELAAAAVDLRQVAVESLCAASKPITGLWGVTFHHLAPVGHRSARTLVLALGHPRLGGSPGSITALDATLRAAFAPDMPPVTDHRRALQTWARLHDDVVHHWLDDSTRSTLELRFRAAPSATAHFDHTGRIERLTDTIERRGIAAATPAGQTLGASVLDPAPAGVPHPAVPVGAASVAA